jgi:hypothetical protein
MKITQTHSKDTIPMTDELMADYRYYASNLKDKSLELIQEVGQVPYLVRYKLDENGNRYSHYLDKVGEDGYKLPDFEAIEADKQKALNNEAKAKAQKYLNDTDFYMTVDKYAELTEDKKAELTKLRAEAREVIRTYEE